MKYALMRRIGAFASIAWMLAIFVFLLAPLVVVVGASFNSSTGNYIDFPPKGFSLAWYGRIDPDQLRSLWVSVMLATITGLMASLLGVPAALGLVRGKFRGKSAVSVLLRSPLQIPAVVIGVSFLKLYYVIGDFLGISLAGTFTGLLIGHVFMATPYVIGSVGSVLERFNLRLEEAAASLGASSFSIFRRITLPVIMPGIYAGGIYAFLASFGDVPVSMFLGSSSLTPFPVELFHVMEYDFDPSILAISTVVIFGSTIAMIALQKLVGMSALLRSGANK